MLKLPEVAQRLGVSEKTARRYIKAGTIPSVFIGNAYRVQEDDLEEYVRQAQVEPGGTSAPKVLSRPSPEAPEAQADEERREELRMFRELLTDAHGLLEEMADEYRKAGATDKLKTLVNVAMFSAIGAEQFVKEEVGPARDRASTRVYAAGNRLEEFIEDLLETIKSTTTEPVGGEVALLDAHRRRRAS